MVSEVNIPVVSEKTNLLNLDREGLVAFFAALGEKSFRASQVMKWIHQQDIADFQLMNNISKSLRDQLEVLAEIKQRPKWCWMSCQMTALASGY